MSIRSWSAVFSDNLVFLKTEKSTCANPGPRKKFRGVFPGVNWPVGATKAAALNWQLGRLNPEHPLPFGAYGSTPGTRLGLSEKPPKTPPWRVTFTGNPVRNCEIVEICQPSLI